MALAARSARPRAYAPARRDREAEVNLPEAEEVQHATTCEKLIYNRPCACGAEKPK